MTFVAYDIELSETLSGTPNVLEYCNNSNTLQYIEFLDDSHTSEPALMLHSRAAPSVRGNITAQSVLTQGEIPEKGRKKLMRLFTQTFRVSLIFSKNLYQNQN